MKIFGDKIVKTLRLESDEYIGIPAEITVIYDRSKGEVKIGYSGATPIIIYTVGTSVPRIGTLSDEEIISGMLERGYVVCVLDYLGNKKALSPVLDWSVQKIRQRFISGEIFEGIDGFPKGAYKETFVVPAGYDVSLNNIYWAFDRHATDGSLEKIVDIWNTDFRGVHGDRLIKWTDKNGARKETQAAHDGSMPVWYDASGNEDENGLYVKAKHTKANLVSDCVKPDGSMIDLNLYMHIVYPTAPDKKVPVMCLAASVEHLASGTASETRPHLNGFLFNGYAGVAYDYGYTPMARLDHYGYFDGNSREGCVTGDNVAYSMKFYNYHIDMAAMRYVRYLTMSDKKFSFDTNAVGVYGNSKGGSQTYLGAEDPSAFMHARTFVGHHGETRYENGKTEDIGDIRGGEEQPWSSYNGEKISSRANLVYSSCGAVQKAVTTGHSPMFISCNRRDTSCYTGSNTMVNLCRIYDIPTMWLEVPADHSLTYGEDLMYGVDSYKALFDFAGYYLKGDAVKVIGARVIKYTSPYEAVIMFSGAVDESEISKISIKNSKGEDVKCSVVGKFGGLEWTFIPENAEFNETYTINIPDTLVGKNQKRVQSGYTYTFESEKGEKSSAFERDNISVTAKKCADSCRYIMFEVKNDGVNTVSAYTKNGEKVASVNVSGKGWYKLDIGSYLDTLSDSETANIVLKTEKEAGNITVIDESLADSLGKVTAGRNARSSFATAPDGKPSLKVDAFDTYKGYKFEEFYNTPIRALGCGTIIKKDALDDSDMGRRFRISFKAYDTVSRLICYHLNHCTCKPESVADYRRSEYNTLSRPGEWVEYSFEYTVYEPMYGDHGKIVKDFGIACESLGNLEAAIYFADVKCEEIITDVEFGKAFFVCSDSSEEILPEGKSPIVCPNNPWEKNLVLDKK